MSVEEQLKGLTLAEIFGERVPDAVVDGLVRVGERDDRAMWILRLLVEQKTCLRKFAGWYAGVPGSALPDPFLSTLLRTGSDGDGAMAHRMRSLARAIVVGQPLRTAVFVLFVMMFETLFDELENIFDAKEVGELRRRIEDIVGYLEHAEKKSYAEDVVGKIIDGMVGDFLSGWKRLEERCVERERMLLGDPSPDLSVRVLQEKVDGVAKDVAILRKKGRPSPVGAEMQKRVLGLWFDYEDHPEWCKSDVGGRRVYVRDFWACVRERLRPQGIDSIERLQRVLKTARQNALRGALGEDLEARTRARKT